MQQEECEHKTRGEWDTLREMYGSSEISHDCSAPVGTFLCNLNKKLKNIYIHINHKCVLSKDEIEENSHRSRFQCAVYKLLVVVCKKNKQKNKITGKNFIKMFTLQIYVVNDLVYFMGKTVLFIMFSWNVFSVKLRRGVRGSESKIFRIAKSENIRPCIVWTVLSSVSVV